MVRGQRRRWRDRARLLPGALLGVAGLLVAVTLVRAVLGITPAFSVTAGQVVIALSAVVAALRPVLRRGERTAWSFLAVGTLSWLVGDLYWVSQIEPQGEEAGSPNAADFWYLAFYPCAAVCLLLLAARHARGARKALLLDGAVAGLGGAAGWALVFEVLVVDHWHAAVLFDFAYPLGDLVLLGAALGVLAAQAWRVTRVWWLLSGGCLLLVASDLGFLLSERYETGGLADLGWPIGFALLAVAAWQPSPVARARITPPALAVPMIVTVASVAVLVASVGRQVAVAVVALAAAALLGATLRMVLAFRELRELVESRRQAVTDELTGLGNRRVLQDRLAELLLRRGAGEVVAVLLLDLDRFKEVNDALGHHVGDELLRRIGPRLAGVLRDDDTLVRLGGDEFALLLGPGGGATHHRTVAERVRESLRRPFRLEGVELHIDVSVGIAVAPEHGTTVGRLLQCADVAMYEAKRSRSGTAVYSPDRDEHDRQRLHTIAQLHAAIATGQLVCHYQPQCDLASGAIVGAEALVRWQHPDRGLLGPATFLGLAAQVGLMPDLTRQVLRAALSDCRAWQRVGLELTVSVNLSGLAVGEADLADEVAHLLAEHGLPPDRLVLEVTEDAMLVGTGSVTEVVSRLRDVGVRISLDDYGTGHSSLARLRSLPVHELKLDRSYIAGLGEDERDAAIVSSTVALAHALGLSVVAEGVETPDDWHSLEALRCDRAQGFLLSEPLPPDEFLRWLHGPGRARRWELVP